MPPRFRFSAERESYGVRSVTLEAEVPGLPRRSRAPLLTPRMPCPQVCPELSRYVVTRRLLTELISLRRLMFPLQMGVYATEGERFESSRARWCSCTGCSRTQ